jgi:dTDP-4-amino-4,6-dideoxygalactose transaminase
VDIDPQTFNIDPAKIEGAITARTSAIIATHVYGNPCDIDAIQKTANEYGLKVIYDGAHCFGTTYKGASVFNYGDISTTSFHATKLFHTIEGGAIFANDSRVASELSVETGGLASSHVEYLCSNRMSEVHAAMGLCNLKYVDQVLSSRKEQSRRYDSWLGSVHSQRMVINDEVEFNCAYYPLLLRDEASTLQVMRDLHAYRISPRRYFFPSLNTVPFFFSRNLSVSESISKRIICLPQYFNLTMQDIDYVANVILRSIRGST